MWYSGKVRLGATCLRGLQDACLVTGSRRLKISQDDFAVGD